MSRSARMLKLLKKEPPGPMVCKAVLVTPPVEYLVKGFILETTMERNLRGESVRCEARIGASLPAPERGFRLCTSIRAGSTLHRALGT